MERLIYRTLIWVSLFIITLKDFCHSIRINMSGLDGLEVHSNIIINSTTETVGTRSAIVASASSRNGRIYNNKVRGANQKHGVELTSSTQNIQTFNNDVVGLTKPMANNSVGGFEGTYIHSANGHVTK